MSFFTMVKSQQITPVVAAGKALSPGSAVSEKVRTRLEELDDLEEVYFHLGACL